MKILALIAARGGSKRLPDKNILLLGGKPLIVWSIDIVKGVPEICDILVSTDDLVIANICKKAEAYVPWLRPKELASDDASSVDVALHALDWYESHKGPVDGILLLQPTSPFRTKKTIQEGIELFKKHNGNSVLGVSRANENPMWMLKLEQGLLVPLIRGHEINDIQDSNKNYIINGSFYLVTPEDLRSRHSFFGEKIIPLIVKSQRESIDIDTAWDWKIAEKFFMNEEN
jgi:CMP-N,N'-diacetyllegionaminic acid synthase